MPNSRKIFQTLWKQNVSKWHSHGVQYFYTFIILNVLSQHQFWKSELHLEWRGRRATVQKKIQSFWNTASSTKSFILVFFSFHSYCNSNLYCNIPLVNWAWLWEQIIFKFEAFCVHRWCWHTRRSAWSNRCDKWHIGIKMPEIVCRCHPIIILLYTPLLSSGCLLYWIKRIPFFSVRNNSKHRAFVTANLSKILSHKQIRTKPLKILKA